MNHTTVLSLIFQDITRRRLQCLLKSRAKTAYRLFFI